jgi:hypothetical protein
VVTESEAGISGAAPESAEAMNAEMRRPPSAVASLFSSSRLLRRCDAWGAAAFRFGAEELLYGLLTAALGIIPLTG